MRLNLIGLVLFAGLLFMGATCERPVDLDLGVHDPEIVITSNFTAGQYVWVSVASTSDVLDAPSINFIDDATLEVFHEEDLLETLTFISDNRNDPYYASTQFIPEEGETYMLKAAAPGFETIMAESYIPFSVEIGQLYVSNVDIMTSSTASNFIDYEYDVSLQFEDPADERNYYHLTFSQRIYPFTISEGDTIIGLAIDNPVRFSSDNNNNSFIAFYNGGVLFEDKDLDGGIVSTSFRLSTTLDSENQLLGPLVARLRTVSDDYYDFYNSLSRQQGNGNDPFSQPVFVDSNVENGEGVFAGYSQSVDSTHVIN